MLAHHALAYDWSNISLATTANAEWLVRSALCVIDSSEQTNTTDLCVLFVKGIYAYSEEASQILCVLMIKVATKDIIALQGRKYHFIFGGKISGH